MTITSRTTHVSDALIDMFLWNVRHYLERKYGSREAERMSDPLFWYVRTNRASLDFLGKLIEKKPYLIGRVLAKGGSYDEAIQRVKNYIGYREEV